MKKLLLFWIALLLTGTTLTGQTTLLTEGWESATNNSNVPPTGWGIDLLGYSNITYYMSSGTNPVVAPYEGSRLVDFESYSYGTGTTNRLKRTTAISTVGYGSVSVDFAWYTDPGYAGTTTEGVIVQWSTDGTTWTSAGTTWMRYAATAQWVVNTQVLPAGAAGQPVLYVAFLFNSNFGDDCHMDIMHVKGSVAAPTVLLGEGWELATNNSNVPPPGWGIDLLGYTNITYYFSSGTYPTVAPYEGSRLVDFESYSYGSGTTNRLKRVTPISTVGYTGINVDFAWYTDPGYAGTTTEGVIIQWSTDGSTWTSAGTTWMRYATTAQWVVNTQNLPVGAENQPTLYIAFLFNSNFGNDSHMDIIHVKGTGAALPPTVTTTAATNVLGTTATLNGTVNANGTSTAVTFQYGLTVAYGTTVPGTPTPVTGSTVTPVLANITGLTPNTLYHYRCVGVGSGTTNGNDMTFTTAALAPTTVTLAATGVTTTGATLNGTVNANGASTAVTFDYGLTVAYGTTVPGTPTPVTGNTATPVSATLTGLATNTTYHFRVNGTNSVGTTNGGDLTFITVCPLASAAGTITGPVNVCKNGTGYVYTVPVIANATSYNWTLPTGATITAGNNTNSITVSYSGTAVSGTITVYGSSVCGNGTVSPGLAVTVNAQPTPTVTGPATLCAGAAGNVYTTQAGMTGYTWTVSAGGTITAGAGTNAITVSWSAAGAQTVCVNYANANGCTATIPVCYNVTVNALPVPTITGPASPCVNSAGNVYTTEAGMTGYTWTVSAGGSITSGTSTNAVTVTWSTAGAKTVTVNYANASSCTATAPASYAVTVNALPVPTIAGSATLCQYSTGVVYTTQAGMTNYLWTVSPGGVITAGGTATNNTVTVNWNTAGSQSVSVNYTNANGCTAVAATSYSVTVNPTPVPTIGSNNAPCVGSTGNMYYTEGGMTNYVWTVSAGGAIASGQGTSAINVTWTGVGAQSVTVNYTNASLCPAPTASVYNLFVNPMPNAAGSITGTATLCAGTNGVAYSCAEILNAASYTWALPAGATIATGAGTKSITVNFSASTVSGNILVSGTNSCGNGTSSPAFAVTVNPLPAAAGAITGPSSVCVNATGVAYSVPTIANATTYVWTVPTGATITSGATTKSIVVSFGPAAGTGAVTVKGTNTCGNGAVSVNFNVTMNDIPAAPVVTATGAVLTSSASGGNQWYYAGAAIAGATSQSYTVTHNTGYYWCVVTTNGCASPVSNKVWVVVTGQQELQNLSFNVYPVPNDGRFTVTIASPVQETFNIEVFNQLGAKIFELGNVQVNGTFEKEIDLRPIAGGVYSVVFLNNEHKVVKKVIINK